MNNKLSIDFHNFSHSSKKIGKINCNKNNESSSDQTTILVNENNYNNSLQNTSNKHISILEHSSIDNYIEDLTKCHNFNNYKKENKKENNEANELNFLVESICKESANNFNNVNINIVDNCINLEIINLKCLNKTGIRIQKVLNNKNANVHLINNLETVKLNKNENKRKYSLINNLSKNNMTNNHLIIDRIIDEKHLKISLKSENKDNNFFLTTTDELSKKITSLKNENDKLKKQIEKLFIDNTELFKNLSIEKNKNNELNKKINLINNTINTKKSDKFSNSFKAYSSISQSNSKIFFNEIKTKTPRIKSNTNSVLMRINK